MMNSLKTIFAAACASFAMASAFAGPVIIAGTDADDHGSATAAGVNLQGWEFMQRAFSNIGRAVTNGNKVAVCIGCNGLEASAAFASSFAGASLTGWTTVTLTTAAQITNFFAGTGATNINNSGIIYMPTVADNIDGGIDDTQLAIVNLNGGKINSFLSTGGGLFTQEQTNSTIGYRWLTSLLPGLVVSGDNAVDASNLRLTAQGQAQFPGLTDAELSAATPWHAYFTGNFGALQSLVVGNGDGVGGFNDTVVLGGGFAGGGGVIVCGTPGQPACPPVGVPVAPTLPMLALGLTAILGLRRKA
jgi:hypothetical protein